MKRLALTVAVLCLAQSAWTQTLFSDHFTDKLGEGWSWIRENRESWRVRGGALEVHVEPGNMWGGANNARNVLVRPAPEVTDRQVEVSVTFENKPTNQYEQVDLVWYYDDSNMVKIGQELVDGKLSVVMGREEKDSCRTIVIAPLSTTTVRVRFSVKGNEIHGEFLPAESKEWQEAGKCTVPAVPGKQPKISLQCYQGPKDAEHWARITNFEVARRSGK